MQIRRASYSLYRRSAVTVAVVKLPILNEEPRLHRYACGLGDLENIQSLNSTPRIDPVSVAIISYTPHLPAWNPRHQTRRPQVHASLSLVFLPGSPATSFESISASTTPLQMPTCFRNAALASSASATMRLRIKLSNISTDRSYACRKSQYH